MTSPSRYGGTARYYPKSDTRKPCAIAGCDQLTQAISGRCFQHRTDIPVSRTQDAISIAGITFTVDAARALGDRIHDLADEIEKDRT